MELTQGTKDYTDGLMKASKRLGIARCLEEQIDAEAL